MTENFDYSYNKLLLDEGEYSNNPVDRGGETYKGVSRKYHPFWPGWKIIDRYKKDLRFPGVLKHSHELDILCREFYKKYYWNINRLDQIESQIITYELFEIGVNMGTSTAAKFFQEALNMLNRNKKLYSDLLVDGQIGPVTIAAYNSFKHQDNIKILANLINVLQGERYLNILRKDKTQEAFVRGWLKRVIIINY